VLQRVHEAEARPANASVSTGACING